VDVSGHDPRERFKFDVSGDWSINYGENDNGGASRAGIAERNGGDIRFLDGAGLYKLTFANRTHAFSVRKTPAAGSQRRTLIFMYGQTVAGQDMYLRGGIDHAYSANVLGKPCADSAAYDNPCAVPIRQRLRFSNPDQSGDWFLDWYGRESNQSASAQGSPLIWTSNDAANPKTIPKDEVGYTPMNAYGGHYWMLDVEMDCSRTVNGWFELKSFISNGPGWEGDISQSGTPYSSRNHFGQCGKINVFRRGENGARFFDF
jgi:alpha-amylase